MPEKEKDFFEGIDTSLPGLAGLAKGGDAKFLTEGLRTINVAVELATTRFSAAGVSCGSCWWLFCCDSSF